jgi:CRISPR-associated endonuclease/helicase Cas3
MPLSGLYSHLQIPLEVHINNTLKLFEILKKENLPLWNENLEKTLKVSLALHDFGKATEYFQRKIRGEKLKNKEWELSKHSFLSAVYTFFVLKKLFKELKFPLLGYYIVRNHHSGILKDFDKTLLLDDKDVELLRGQVDAIDPTKVNTFIENLTLERDLKELLRFNKGKFLTFIEEAQDLFDELSDEWEEIFDKDLKEFLTLSLLFSLLVDADKTEAGYKGVPSFLVESPEISSSLVEEYKKTLKGRSSVNTLREEAFREVSAFEPTLEEHFYTLTLPTGLGKTLSGLHFALKLKEKLEKETGKPAKLVYSLPFLSVIDQNAEVLEKVLSPSGKKVLVKHHHLSLGEYLKGEDDYEKARLFVEGWNAPVVITTFVQLFESLIPFKNSSARRFNKLTNAVVLIDEVQALPSRFWYLLREYLKRFAKEFNTRFVFMTATQPYLVEGREVIKNRERFFSSVNRYEVELNLRAQTLREFFESFQPEEGKNYLFILNTVKSSKEAYRLLLDKGIPEGQICYLSTSLTPYDRQRRIEDLRKGKYRFAVSTQLVEAGVDIDFSEVIRDFAPLDSLIQSAGRCNRNFNLKSGKFTVLKLVEENGRTYASRIYDPILLQLTEKLLNQRQPKEERELINLTDGYYKEVWNSKSKDKSKKLLESVEKLEISKLTEFKLVEEQPFREDVFIQQTPEAVEVWNKVKNLVRALKTGKLTLWEAKREFETLKGNFFKFVVSVDVRRNKPPFDEELNIHFIPEKELSTYYDPQTGFISEGNTFEEY